MQTLEYSRVTKTGRLVEFLYSECDSKLVDSHTWYLDKDGYAQTSIGKKKVKLHRLILNLKPFEIGDHINRLRYDNRRCNLRQVSKAVNNSNRGIRYDSRSRIKGITWQESIRKWKVQPYINGVRTYLGVYSNLEDAKKRLAKEL